MNVATIHKIKVDMIGLRARSFNKAETRMLDRIYHYDTKMLDHVAQ